MRFFKPFLTVAAVAILIAVANVGAKASNVTFSTDAQFNGGAFGAPLVIGGVTLSFQPIPAGTTVNTPSNTSLGEIVVACTAGGTGCGLHSYSTGTTFNIRITQTVPSAWYRDNHFNAFRLDWRHSSVRNRNHVYRHHP